ncbi:MAG TPA: S-layer homology domain-containing protein [Egicoccus sp.]|nr:S-layer homology domain-containing protein [Egicoccus sp.]HSK22681.1 S-layer homology domain-containing protein [Egicoccus sp.]
MNRRARYVWLLAALAMAIPGATTALASEHVPDGDVAGYHGHTDAVFRSAPDGDAPTFSTAAAPSPTPACPSTVETAEFGDVQPGSTHARAIDCLAWWGVSLGDGNYGYAPAGPVTRAQNASFLARALDATARPLPGDADMLPGAGPADVQAGAPHALPILRVVTSGVMRTRSDGTFRGGVSLRRDEMAVALVAAYDHVIGETPEALSPTGRFTDLEGHLDAATVERAYELGFTSGRSADTFEPAGVVNRAQMASFLTRLLDRLVVDQQAAPPEVPAWDDLPPGRRPAPPLTGEGNTFVFYTKNRDGSLLRWNPCEPIPVHVNYDGAPAGASAAVERAVKLVADASGMRIHVAGTATDKARNDGSVPLVDGRLTIGWADFGHPSLVGYGGPMYTYVGWDHLQIIAGGVAMNSAWKETGDRLVLGLMHELGHAVGLDHAPDPGQVMYHLLAHGRQVAWGDGDLTALRALGDRSSCS